VKRKEKTQAATGFAWSTSGVVPKGNWQGNRDGSRQ